MSLDAANTGVRATWLALVPTPGAFKVTVH
jgi:hypothetical protein